MDKKIPFKVNSENDPLMLRKEHLREDEKEFYDLSLDLQNTSKGINSK